jgi:hypothetical protein
VLQDSAVYWQTGFSHQDFPVLKQIMPALQAGNANHWAASIEFRERRMVIMEKPLNSGNMKPQWSWLLKRVYGCLGSFGLFAIE